MGATKPAYGETFLIDGVYVRLTPKQKRLFVELYNAKGKAVSVRTLTHFVSTNWTQVQQTMRRLRPKLAPTKFRIFTARGVGYRMVRK